MDNLIDYSPKDIAEELFTREPDDPLTNQMLVEREGTDSTYIFEILITILLEGLDIFTKGIKDADLSQFSQVYITQLNPWFRSLGFDISVDCSTVEDSFDGYYCRVVINNSSNSGLFILNNIEDQSYQFLLNGTCLEENRAKERLRDVFAIFEANGVVYKISFDFYIPPDLPTQMAPSR